MENFKPWTYYLCCQETMLILLNIKGFGNFFIIQSRWCIRRAKTKKGKEKNKKKKKKQPKTKKKPPPSPQKRKFVNLSKLKEIQMFYSNEWINKWIDSN